MMKSFLFRLSARICIVSLLYQSLWPSIVMASQMEILEPTKLPKFTEPIVPLRTVPIEAFVTDKEDFSQQTKASIPLLSSRSKIQRHIDKSLEIQSLYPGLQLTEQGLAWSAYGYNFLLNSAGHLLLTAQETPPIALTKVLNIYNPKGDVWLGEGVNLDHLSIQGRNIVHLGKQSHIKHLDVWATAVGTPGLVYNHETASLLVEELTVFEGILQNKGLIGVEKGGRIDLLNHDLINEQTIQLDDGSVIEGARTLRNKGFIKGTKYQIKAQFLENSRTITGIDHKLTITKKLTNSSYIIGTQNEEIICFGDFENTGKIVSKGTSKVIVAKNLTHTDVLRAKHLALTVLGKTVNTGIIEGRESLSLTVKDGENTGTVTTNGTLEAVVQGSFKNVQGINAAGASHFFVKGAFINEGLVGSQTSLLFDGPGTVENKSRFKAPLLQLDTRMFIYSSVLEEDLLSHVKLGAHVQQFTITKEAFLKVKSFKSQMDSTLGLFYSQGTFIADDFTNFAPLLRNAGTLAVKTWTQKGKQVLNEKDGDITVEGKTTFQSESLVNKGEMNFKGIVIGHITDSVNEGRITLSQTAMLTGSTFKNSSYFKAEAIFDWLGDTVENSGEMLIYGYYIRAKRQLINRHLLRWTHDTIGTKHFLNLGWAEQTDQLDAVHPEFQEALNQDTTYKPMTVENRGTLLLNPTYKVLRIIKPRAIQESEGTSELKNVPYRHWFNEGIMRTQRLKISGAEKVLNKGSWEMLQGLSGKIGSFENQGDLVVQKGSSVDMDSFDNKGRAHFHGPLRGQIKTLTNSKGLVFSGKVNVSGTSFQNSQYLETRDALKWIGNFTNTGEAIATTDTGKFVIDGNLTNIQTLRAQKLNLTVLGKTTNTGQILGDESATVTLNTGVNKGVITSPDLTTVIQGTFQNKKEVVSTGINRLVVNGKLINARQGLLWSQDTLALEGSGTLLNRGNVEGYKTLALKNGIFINEHLVLAEGKLLLAPTTLFQNTGTGTLLAKGKTTVSGSGKIQNDKPILKPTTLPSSLLSSSGMAFLQEVHFASLQGTLVNKGSFNTSAKFSGVLSSLRNEGIFGTSQGFSDFTIHDLENIGTIFGDGHLTVTRGRQVPTGRFVADHLDLTVNTSFRNEGTLDVKTKFHTDGAGEFENRRFIQTPLLEMDTRTFIYSSQANTTPFAHLKIGKHVYKITIIEDALLKVTTLDVQMDATLGLFTNQGTALVDHFTNKAPSLKNAGVFTIKTWNQKGKRVLNEETGDFTVEEKSTIRSESLTNKGDMLFKDIITGHITDFVNDGCLTFAQTAMLTGTTLKNTHSLRAKEVMDWLGDTVENTGEMLIYGYYIRAKRQLINRHLLRWTHDTIRTVHFLNLGWAEQTDQLEADYQKFDPALNQDTTYKSYTVENRGTFLMKPTYELLHVIKPGKSGKKSTSERAFKHWINEGVMRTRPVSLDKAETVVNKKTWDYEGGLFGKIGSLENQGTFTVQKASHVTIDSLDNKGTLEFQGSLGGQITALSNSDKLVFSGDVSLTGTILKNSKRLEAKGVLSWQGETIDNAGEFLVHWYDLHASKQVINRHLLRWTHGVIDGSHVLNMGLAEQTNKLDSPRLNFRPSVDKSTTYKPSTLENRGILLITPGYQAQYSRSWRSQSSPSTASFANWHNTGTMRTIGANLDGSQKLFNQGVWELLGQSVGTIGTLENLGDFVVRGGLLEFHHLIHKGKHLVLENGSYTVHDWKDKGAKETFVDKLSLTSYVLSFDAAQTEIADLTLQDAPYLWCNGKLKITSKSPLSLKDCNISGTLELGRGTYKISELYDFGFDRLDPALILHSGAYVMTNKLSNGFGPVVGTKSLCVVPTKSENPLDEEIRKGSGVLHLQKISKGENWIHMIGALRAKKNLIVHAPLYNLAQLLSYYGDQWYGEEALELHGTEFKNDGTFSTGGLTSKNHVGLFLSGPLENKNVLNVPSLVVMNCSTFTNTSQIKAKGPISIGSMGTFDNRVGKIQSQEGDVVVGSAQGNVYVGAPKDLGEGKKKSNGACITSHEGQVVIQAPEGNIFTDYGLISSLGVEGISLIAPQGTLYNRTGSISAYGNIRIHTDAMVNATGGVGIKQELIPDAGNYHNIVITDSSSGRRLFFAPQTLQTSKRQTAFLISPEGIIHSSNGSIILVCNTGLNSGSKLWAAKDIFYRTHSAPDFTAWTIGGPATWLRFEHVMGQSGEFNDGLGPLYVGGLHPVVLSQSDVKAGKTITLTTGNTEITGVVNAQNINMKVDGLSIKGKVYSVALPKGGVLSMLPIALKQPGAQNRLKEGKGVQSITWISDDPQPKDPVTTDSQAIIPSPLTDGPLITALDQLPPAIDPHILRSALNYALSTYLGRLHLYGLSGDDLLSKLLSNTKECIEQLQLKDRPITPETITSFDEALLYIRYSRIEDQDYLVHYLYLPSRYVQELSNVSVSENLKTEGRGRLELEDAKTTSGENTEFLFPNQGATLTRSKVKVGKDLKGKFGSLSMNQSWTETDGKTDMDTGDLKMVSSEVSAKDDLTLKTGKVDAHDSKLKTDKTLDMSGTGSVRMSYSETRSGEKTKMSYPGQDVVLDHVTQQSGSDLSTQSKTLELNHVITSSKGKTSLQTEEILKVTESTVQSQDDLSAKSKKVVIDSSTMSSQQHVNVEAEESLITDQTTKPTVISGDKGVHLRSNGTTEHRRGTETTTYQKGDTIVKVTKAKPPLIIRSPHGPVITESRLEFIAVAPIIEGTSVRFGSKQSDTKILALKEGVETQTTQTQKRKKRSFFGSKTEEVTETTTTKHEVVDKVPEVIATKTSIEVESGIQGTSYLEAPQFTAFEDIVFRGGPVNTRGMFYKDSETSTRTQRGGGTSRYYIGHTEVPHGKMGSLTSNRGIFFNVPFVETHGVNMTTGTLQTTSDSFFGPLVGDITSYSSESRKSSGLFGDKKAQSSLIETHHLVSRPTINAQTMIFGNGTGGTVNLNSVIAKAMTIVCRQGFMESAEQQVDTVETHMRSSNGPKLDLPKPPSLALTSTNSLDRISEIMEKITMGLNGATQFLQVGQNQLPVDSFMMQQGGTLTWSQSRMDGYQTLRQDVPTQVIAQNLTFEGFHPIHLMGINDVDMMQGTGSSLTTEPLKKIYDVRTRTRHQTESFNPFTLTFGYSQQQQDYRLHEETYTPTTAHQMDMTLSETCDLVGFQAKGSGNVSITAPTITLKSVQDVRQEETQTKGFSTSTNLSTGIYEALISIATQTTYQNKSTKDEVKQVTQPSGFDMGGTVALKAETFTNIGGSVQKQGTTIIAQNQLTQGLPNVHHHSEKTCIPSSLIRLAFDGIPLSQSMQEFVQTLQPSTPSENFKSDLYMALDEEGVDPTQSIEILSDPEVQQVVEEVRQHVVKKQTQQFEKQKLSKGTEKLEESIPSTTESLKSLDLNPLDAYIITPEDICEQLRIAAPLIKKLEESPNLAKPIEKIWNALSMELFANVPIYMDRDEMVTYIPPTLLGDFDSTSWLYAGKNPGECSVELGTQAICLGIPWTKVGGFILEKTGGKVIGSALKEVITPVWSKLKGSALSAFIKGVESCGFGSITTETGEVVAFKAMGTDALNKVPYSSRALERLLKVRFPGQKVTSGTLPETFHPNAKLANKFLHIPKLDVYVPFDSRSLPIFDKFVKVETRITGPLLEMSSEAHKRLATLSLKECIAKSQVNAKIFTQEQLRAINAGKSKIPGYIWHHHQEMGRMQLIPRNIHEAVKHVGGNCLWRK